MKTPTNPMSRTPVRRSAVLLFLLTGCASQSPAPPPDAGRFNVLLVSIDTLRADHLGCFGYDKPTSPGLDALCAESVAFTQTISQAPSTLHSHASILTSEIPHHHRASWAARTPLADEAVTLAEVLSDAGFATAAYTGGGQMDRLFGLAQGFDVYQEPGGQRFRDTVRAALPWLDEHAEDRFFLFLHSYETHHPYEPEERYLEAVGDDYDGPLPDQISVDFLRRVNAGEVPIDDADLRHIVATYDAEIRSMDDALTSLIDHLRELGVLDRTLVVFTSDHGEEFDEHGTVGWHSHTLFDELLHVPLVMRFPRGRFAGTRIDRQVRSIDIAPTVLAAVGLPAPPTFEGTDLGALLRGDEVPELVAISRQDRPPSKDIEAVRTEEWKLNEGKLFHLSEDPGELWDITDFAIEQRLQAALDAAVASGTPLEADAVVPTGKTLDELKDLGYLQ
ncbi:MAG: sulfatase [Thermoanaerobaculia bacterium]